MINRKIKILSLFIAFLIVSITPASATIISDITGNHSTEYPIQNKGLIQEQQKQTIQDYQNQIHQLSEEIRTNTEDFKENFGLFKHYINKWKFKKAFEKIDLLSVNMDNLKDEVKSLETTTKNLENAEDQLGSNKDNATSNSLNMATELQKRLNVVFDVVGSNGILNVGDIVQYKDDEGYYRYVTINQTTENSVTLMGKDYLNKTISKNTADSRISYMLKPATVVNNYTVVDTAYQIQIDDINKQYWIANDKDSTANILITIAYSVSGLAFLLLIVVLPILIGIDIVLASTDAFTMGLLTKRVKVVSKRIAVTAVTGGICAAVGVTILVIGFNLKHSATELFKVADADLTDLNHFLGNPNRHMLNADNMILNTTMNKALEGVFNVTDSSKDEVLNASMVSKPEHGNITINGTRFVYTPANDYVGNDTFTFNVKDSMGFISNIARVNIQVKENIVAGNMSINTSTNKAWEGVFNVTHPDSGVLNAILVSAPEHGNLTIHGTKFVYIPTNGYVGNDTFSYRLKDNTSSLSNIGIVNIQVNALNILGGINVLNMANGILLNGLNTFIPLFNIETKNR